MWWEERGGEGRTGRANTDLGYSVNNETHQDADGVVTDRGRAEEASDRRGVDFWPGHGARARWSRTARGGCLWTHGATRNPDADFGFISEMPSSKRQESGGRLETLSGGGGWGAE